MKGFTRCINNHGKYKIGFWITICTKSFAKWHKMKRYEFVQIWVGKCTRGEMPEYTSEMEERSTIQNKQPIKTLYKKWWIKFGTIKLFSCMNCWHISYLYYILRLHMGQSQLMNLMDSTRPDDIFLGRVVSLGQIRSTRWTRSIFGLSGKSGKYTHRSDLMT